jgi:type IV pilus assembly protein PilP
MPKHPIKFITVFCFVCLFIAINGCDKNEPSKKPAAVSKKIVAKQTETAPANVPAAVNVNSKQTPEVKAEVKEVKAETKAVKTDIPAAKAGGGGEKPAVPAQPPPIISEKGKQEKPVKVDEIKKDSAAPAVKQKAEVSSSEVKPAASSPVLTPQPSAPDHPVETAKTEPETIPIYNPRGKIDPFVPLFKEEGPLAGDEKGKRGRVPKTPLEMIDLGQLKLVAVMRAPSGNKALVEEASGKGYIVTKGTYLGVNSGRVIKILRDRIIVEEEAESIVGKGIIQQRELKLQKPLGEE